MPLFRAPDFKSSGRMWVRVRGIGKATPGVWNDVAMMIVP